MNQKLFAVTYSDGDWFNVYETFAQAEDVCLTATRLYGEELSIMPIGPYDAEYTAARYMLYC